MSTFWTQTAVENMDYKNVLYAVEGPVATLSVNRPHRLNAVNTATLHELLAAAREAEADHSVRVLILTGTGDRSFIAGADVNEMVENDYLEALRFAELGQKLCSTLEEMAKPVIAAINGYALGAGCEIAVACDFAYAAEGTELGMPEVNLGIIPGFGGAQRLLRRIPAGIAREMVLVGEAIDAEEALRIGLVNGIYSSEELMAAAMKTALLIASKGPLAVARAKGLMQAGLDMPLAAANTLERVSFAGLFATNDQTEGMQAFLQKREPQFKGN